MKNANRPLRALAACASMCLLAAAAQAAPVGVTVSAVEFIAGAGYGYEANESTGTLLDVAFTGMLSSQSFVLPASGATHSFDVGSVVFRERSTSGGIKAAETDDLGVIARLTFTSPFGSTVDVLASGAAVLGSTNDADVDLTIDWAPIEVDLGTGQRLGISLADLSFTGNPGLPQTLTQAATITLLGEPSIRSPQQVPEPGTLALAAGALAALGVGRRRR